MADLPPDKIDKLRELFKFVGDSLTKEDFIKSFKTVVDFVQKAGKTLADRVDEQFKARMATIDQALKETIANSKNAAEGVKKDNSANFEKLRKDTLGDIGLLKKKTKSHDDFNANVLKVHTEHENRINELDNRTKNPLPEPIPADTPEIIREKLLSLPDDKKLTVGDIKGLVEELEKFRKYMSRPAGAIAYARGQIKLYDLSPFLNGSTTTFPLPAFWRVINVISSSTPNAFQPGVDYTTNAASMTISFIGNIQAASTLAAGQTLLVEYAEP